MEARRASDGSVLSTESSIQGRRRQEDLASGASLDSITTKLLTETKQLFDSFNGWAFGRYSVDHVSDNFVRLGNQFNLCLAVFEKAGIDMGELVGIPDSLREVLEEALAEQQDKKTLEAYMPKIRGVIIHLLQEMKLKQQLYREKVIKPSETQIYSAFTSNRVQSSTLPEPKRSAAATATATGGAGSPRKTSLPDLPTTGEAMPAPLPPERPQRISRVADVNDPISSASTPSRRRVAPAPPPLDGLSHLPTSSGRASPSSNGSPTRPSSRLEELKEGERGSVTSGVPVARTLPPKSSSRAPTSKGTIPPAPNLALPPPPPEMAAGGPVPTSEPGYVGDPLEARLPPGLSKLGLERRASKRYSAYTMKRIEGIASPSSRSRLMSTTAEEAEDANGETGDALGRESSRSPGVITSTHGPMSRPRASSHASNLASLASNEVVTLFLHYAGHTKKVQTTGDTLSMASLRMMFIANFSLNSGTDTFPLLYIRDRTSGVDYELEDIADVQDKMMISLHDRDSVTVHQKTAAQVEELSRILKEDLLPRFERLAVASNGPGGPEPGPSAKRSINGDDSQMSVLELVPTLPTQPSSSGAGDLRDMRHELGVMRQLIKQTVGQAKDEVSSFRSEVAGLKELAKEDSGSIRREIALGQEDLDRRSGVVVVMSTELQDQVEDLRNDVVERGIVPKAPVLSTVGKKLDTLNGELQWLEDFVQAKNDAWRQQWTLDVEVILKQQDFLEHIQGLLKDLRDDYVILEGITKGLKAHAATRRPGGNAVAGSGPSRAQLRRRETGDGPRNEPKANGSTPRDTVLSEVRALQVDPEKRVQAIAEAEKRRQAERAALKDQSGGNEFKRELGSFVGNAKLKMAGGHEEVERERARRDDVARRQLLSNDVT